VAEALAEEHGASKVINEKRPAGERWPFGDIEGFFCTCKITYPKGDLGL